MATKDAASALVPSLIPLQVAALLIFFVAPVSLSAAVRGRAFKHPQAERCFAAYVEYSRTKNLADLDTKCPIWREWISTDGNTPDKIHASNAAVILGHRHGNATTGRSGTIADIGIDVGSGWSNSRVTGGLSTGVHILSIPVAMYVDCCSADDRSLAHAISQRKTTEVCSLLRDSIKGGLMYAENYTQLDQATSEHDFQAFSQCYHRSVDVNYLHLHTTAGVRNMREVANELNDGRWFGETQLSLAPSTYNACVCEPSGRPGGRGHCPTAQPRDAEYLVQATESLCRNVGGSGGVDLASIDAVCGSCGALAK
eukprot:TRINITY_DN58403_c0_g1_i1.p1 TRINITY_DN58403_c0_g1~~TRINITY_DN58403_c0_g1_i1.p1  ORF type:complete len:312 (+),score=36.00 TRINITY_DN58403_c0_g1_i1:90-1025(+)